MSSEDSNLSSLPVQDRTACSWYTASPCRVARQSHTGHITCPTTPCAQHSHKQPLCAQAEKRRQKLVKSKALQQKKGGRRLLPALPLDEEPEKELAPVARNSICWGTFMATSANARYQLLNGLEERYLVRCCPG